MTKATHRQQTEHQVWTAADTCRFQHQDLTAYVLSGPCVQAGLYASLSEPTSSLAWSDHDPLLCTGTAATSHTDAGLMLQSSLQHLYRSLRIWHKGSQACLLLPQNEHPSHMMSLLPLRKYHRCIKNDPGMLQTKQLLHKQALLSPYIPYAFYK